MEDIIFTPTEVAAIYKGGNKEAKALIKEVLGTQFSEVLPVTERVKTLEDAIAELGEEHHAVKAYKAAMYGYCDELRTPDVIAYLKLRIITTALNEGWEPRFTKDERRWHGWYDLISKDDYEALSDEEKSRCVGRSHYYANASGGLVCSHACSASSHSDAYNGARLAFKTEALAEYAAKQFIGIYADFCFIPEQKKA